MGLKAGSYLRNILSGIALGLITCVALPAVGQEPLLPLPMHPEREEIEPERTMPRPAQSSRDLSRASPYRTSSSLPRPGNPSRNLAPPGSSASSEEPAAEGDEEAPEEAEAPPGLFDFLPHEFNGITAEYIYTGEFFTKARGGLNPANASAYRSNLDVVLTFDTKAMQLWDNGRFFLYGQDAHGRCLSPDSVGDYQYFSNLESAPRDDLTQISEYWYQHSWVDSLLWIKIGKQDANADFAFVDLGGDFINSSFGLIPTVPIPTFPNPGLGLAGFAQLTEEVLLAGGVYDGAPEGGQFGFNTLGRFGAMSILQATIKTGWGSEGQLPQTVRVGVWQHSGDWEEVGAIGPPRTFNQNYGTFASIDQLLFKEPGEAGDEQGLGVFAQFGWAPPNRNPVQEYYGAGLTYRGLLAGRDRDLVGFGVANVLFSTLQRPITGESYETAIELFYKCMLGDYVSVQPDVQFIANPGGLYQDALLFGVRFEMVL
ncbi:carbohydrate porin [Anatilimnocola sp. NA78]|uniref:carbohydrate porin n=1 Tax=Anatilimnocola sp. NA78 TaxID=3415683 RepID=UPI003CE4D6F8